MAKRMRETTSLVPPGAEERALRLQREVEALAKSENGNELGTGLDGAESMKDAQNLNQMGKALDAGLPMLVRTTETGVYIKWSLMLQDQLARIKAAYDQLKEENAALHKRLRTREQAMQPQPNLGSDYPLTMSRDPSYRSAASAARTDFNIQSAQAQAGGSASSSVEVEKTPRTTEICDGAETLVALASPEASPKVSRDANAINQADASAYPVDLAKYEATYAASLVSEGSASATAGTVSAAWSPSMLSEQDELNIADLLASPNFTASPWLRPNSQQANVGGALATVKPSAATSALGGGALIPRATRSPRLPGSPHGASPLGLRAQSATGATASSVLTNRSYPSHGQPQPLQPLQQRRGDTSNSGMPTAYRRTGGTWTMPRSS